MRLCGTYELLKEKQERAAERARVHEPTHGETWSRWHRRYLEVHESLGKLTRDMKGTAEKWVGSRIGTVPMTAVTCEQIVAIRDAITRAVLAEEISSKRGMNLWSDLVMAPFSRAFTDDDPRTPACASVLRARTPRRGSRLLSRRSSSTTIVVSDSRCTPTNSGS